QRRVRAPALGRSARAPSPDQELPRQRVPEPLVPDPELHRGRRQAGHGDDAAHLAADGPRPDPGLSWHMVQRDGPEWWKALGRRMYAQTFGMAGMFDQDDTENWEAQTRNANAALVRDGEVLLDYTMGLHQEPLADFPGPGTVYDGKFSEAAAR